MGERGRREGEEEDGGEGGEKDGGWREGGEVVKKLGGGRGVGERGEKDGGRRGMLGKVGNRREGRKKKVMGRLEGDVGGIEEEGGRSGRGSKEERESE